MRLGRKSVVSPFKAELKVIGLYRDTGLLFVNPITLLAI